VTHVNDLLMAAVLFGSAWVLRIGVIPSQLQAAFFTIPAVLLIWSLLWQVTVEGTALNFTYAMFVLIGFGATSLSATPYMCGAVLSVIAACLVAVLGPIGQAGDWILVALTAAGIGAILLRIRLQSIIALADANALAKELATLDQLTGALNRHGLLEHAPDLWATARRYDEGLFVAFIDIRGLKKANDKFGHEYGDSLILAAAEAVKGSMREGDLLSRWGGDEFLVVGIGDHMDAEAFASSVESSEEPEVIDSEMGGLSIGIAAGSPLRDTIEELTSRADEDMYRRRANQ
jgi:diguanylate cyclase (GGDEF)-like protein